MRASLWIGLLTLLIGVGFFFLGTNLVQTQTTNSSQTVATGFATALFIVFSALFIGIGTALIAHWIFGFFPSGPAFAIETFLGFALFFIGIGITIMNRSPYSALFGFLTFFTISIALFCLAVTRLFGGISSGVHTLTKKIGKKLSRKK